MEGDSGQLGIMVTEILFQSTPSAWRETAAIDFPGEGVNISIHSLRMEGDVVAGAHLVRDMYFNPLPPHGGRHKDK